MKLTATNGNKRNGLTGQRVTITLRGGQAFHKYLPAGGALRRKAYRDELVDFAHVCAATESAQRHGLPGSRGALAMADLFAECKARLLIVHGRREVGHGNV